MNLHCNASFLRKILLDQELGTQQMISLWTEILLIIMTNWQLLHQNTYVHTLYLKKAIWTRTRLPKLTIIVAYKMDEVEEPYARNAFLH